MNWEMLAAVGQLAAVCIGIPSIIYLAVQIRTQTKERRQSAVNALTVQWGDLTCAFHESAEFSAIFLRGVQSFHDLDAVSKLMFSAFFNRFLNYFEGMYFSHRDGILMGSSWGKIERTISDLFAYPGVQQWWETRRQWYTEEFASVVDEIIAKGSEPKVYATYNLGNMPSSYYNQGLESPLRVRQTQLACHQTGERNAFHHRDVRQQSRSFARRNQSLRHSLNALAFFSRRQDQELLGAISRGLLDCPRRV